MADMTTAEKNFRAEMGTIIQHGFLANTMALGVRLGLFDFLAQASDPLTSQEIADAVGYKERYVREWLGSMACAGILEEKNEKFWLPEDKRQTLSGPDNMMTFSWIFNMATNVTDDLMKCFRKDGPSGLPYSSFPLEQEWRHHAMTCGFKWKVIQGYLQQVPGLIEELASGIEVCEIGCSMGNICIMLGQQFPKSTFYGIDINEQAIQTATLNAAKQNITNVKFQHMDCCAMPTEWTAKWDYMVTIDVVHDLGNANILLKEMKRVLRPTKSASIVDIFLHSNISDNKDVPMASLLYDISLFHCLPLSLQAKHGEGLGATWGIEKATKLLREAGFTDVQTKGDIGGLVHYICK